MNDHDAALAELRDILCGKAPEPYVNLYVNRGGQVFGFPKVRGIKYADGILTWEDDEERLTYFPAPDFWHNEYCEDQY